MAAIKCVPGLATSAFTPLYTVFENNFLAKRGRLNQASILKRADQNSNGLVRDRTLGFIDCIMYRRSVLVGR